MVQYVLTPWRDRRELLGARRQFYPQLVSPSTSALPAGTSSSTGAQDLGGRRDGSREENERAVSRVSMWMQRGNCPHMVESTALLTAAILTDEAGDSSASASSYAVRAAYSAAFSRFVTGLLDVHQDKGHKMSMYNVAKTIGLPATFVELRHQATHEQLPSLTRLRVAARKALHWIWGYYWVHLAAEDAQEDQQQQRQRGGGIGSGGGNAGLLDDDISDIGLGDTASLRMLLLRYLQSDAGARDDAPGHRRAILRQVQRYGDLTGVLQLLDEIEDSAVDSRVLLGSVELSREILQASLSSGEPQAEDGGEDEPHTGTRDAGRVRAELVQAAQALQDTDELSVGVNEGDHDMEADDDEGDDDEGDDEEDEQKERATVKPPWSRHEGPWMSKPIGIV